jgi:hypothetical protein
MTTVAFRLPHVAFYLDLNKKHGLTLMVPGRQPAFGLAVEDPAPRSATPYHWPTPWSKSHVATNPRPWLPLVFFANSNLFNQLRFEKRQVAT